MSDVNVGLGGVGTGWDFSNVEFAPISGLDLGYGPGVSVPGAQPSSDENKPENISDEERIRRELRKQYEEEQARLRAERQRDARQTILKILSDYGLAELGDYVYNEIIVKETVDITNPDAIIYALREQPAYQKRFAANAERVKRGLSELDPS